MIKKNSIIIFVVNCSDIIKGTKGKVVKVWRDKYRNEYAKIYFGRNLTGQRLFRNMIALDCIKEIFEPFDK